LREAREEIGLEARFVSVVGYLADHILLSGFRVTPVVAFVRPGFELALDEQEVSDTFEVPLSYVFEPANQRSQRRNFGGGAGEIRVWDIQYQGRNIWGATAGMLLNLYRLCVADDPARSWSSQVSAMSDAERATTALLELMARLRDPNHGVPGIVSRPSQPSHPSQSKKRTRLPMRSIATIRNSCATSWATCCFKLYFTREWPRSAVGSISRAWRVRFTISS